jgi:hypothetical protein
MGDVMAYDWIPNPILAYTQVSFLCCYIAFDFRDLGMHIGCLWISTATINFSTSL